MRVLVCGGRDFCDWRKLSGTLTNLHMQRQAITEVVHGNAIGADWLAKAWAISAGIPEKPFPAKWSEHGKAAGPIRNQQMLDEGKPNLVVAFPGGAGTRDMVTRAKKAGIEIVEVQ